MVFEEWTCLEGGWAPGTELISAKNMNVSKGKDSPIIALALGMAFLFVAWCHVEDRVIAPLLLSEERAEHFDAVLETVANSPDRVSPTGKGGWEGIAGHHSLYFDHLGPIEFPRSLAASLQSLVPGARYEVSVQPWGTGHWRAVKSWLPTAIVEIINNETRSAEGHRMLVSLGQNGVTVISATDTISQARQNVLPGIGLALFFGLIGLVFIAHLILFLLGRREASPPRRK